MNNFEKIKAMSIDEMAKMFDEGICKHCSYSTQLLECVGKDNCLIGFRQWLESEAK